ncbi:hypothetical protein [Streptomyces sp. NBC_01518]|uniref:hypothetical protein n=1 Tax=Streptomyces sp. NBC_01518 TaxID=2903891 RepID=UPI00386409E7
MGAGPCPVPRLLLGRYAEGRGWAYTVYAAVTDEGGLGLVRLAGVLGDPFAAEA